MLHKPETKYFIALITSSHGGPTPGKPQQPGIMMQGGGIRPVVAKSLIMSNPY